MPALSITVSAWLLTLFHFFSIMALAILSRLSETNIRPKKTITPAKNAPIFYRPYRLYGNTVLANLICSLYGRVRNFLKVSLFSRPPYVSR